MLLLHAFDKFGNMMDKLIKVTQPGSGDKDSNLALEITLLTAIQIDFSYLLAFLSLFFDPVDFDALFLN